MRIPALILAAIAAPAFAQDQDVQRQRLDDVSARQLIEVKPDTPPELRPYELQKAESERRPLTVPAKEFPLRTADGPRPLPGAPGGTVRVIEVPR